MQLATVPQLLPTCVVPLLRMLLLTSMAGLLRSMAGDPGDNFYVVTSGELDAFIKAGGDEPIQEYRQGDSFGELALLYNRCSHPPKARGLTDHSGGSIALTGSGRACQPSRCER